VENCHFFRFSGIGKSADSYPLKLILSPFNSFDRKGDIIGKEEDKDEKDTRYYQIQMHNRYE
jgi:hypothetical protein